MSKHPHTTGPWVASKPKKGPSIFWKVRAEKSDGRNFMGAKVAWDVATVSPGAPDNSCTAEEAAEANARLISAAPEMLDMLKTIENDGKQVPQWLWDRIQSVIAKAEGRK